MPPKTQFTKDEVLNAAYSLAEECGISCLTARNVARKLNSSVAPVYSNFDSVEQLKTAVLLKAREGILHYAKKKYTDRVFLNIGTGLTLFANEHKALFKSLFMESDEYREVVQGFTERISEIMKKDMRFSHISETDRKDLLNKMWIFTHGYASLICIGFIKINSINEIITMLEEVGGSVIGSVLRKYEKQ